MPFKRFVETGRVAYISGGRYCGKLCSIVDVIDQTRVLVDGPTTGVPRIPVRLNQIRLTKHLIKFPFRGSTRVVRKAWKSSEVLQKWKGGQWHSNLAKRKLRRKMSDFDRFKLRHARKIRNALRTKEYCALLKGEKKRKSKMLKANTKWRIAQQKAKNPEKAKEKAAAKAAAKAERQKKTQSKSGKTKSSQKKKELKSAKPKTAKPAIAKPKPAKQATQKPEGEKAATAKATSGKPKK